MLPCRDTRLRTGRSSRSPRIPSIFSAANYVGPEASGPPPVEHPIDDAVEWVADAVAGGWVSEHTGSGGYETVIEDVGE